MEEYGNKRLRKWQKWMITFWPVAVASCFIKLLFTTPGSHEALFWVRLCLLAAFGPWACLLIPKYAMEGIREWWKWINI